MAVVRCLVPSDVAARGAGSRDRDTWGTGQAMVQTRTPPDRMWATRRPGRLLRSRQLVRCRGSSTLAGETAEEAAEKRPTLANPGVGPVDRRAADLDQDLVLL